MDSSSSNLPHSSTPTWPDRIETLSHILTHQTLAPSLHSQFFVSLRVPCFLNWSFPPFLCPSPNSLPSWTLSFFLSRLGSPRNTWRSLCPFQQPPPCLLSPGVDPAPERWGPEERKAYVSQQLGPSRGRGGVWLPQLLLAMVPNVALLSLLLRDPLLWSKPR